MRFLIVDAHSVIFSWPELHALHVRRMLLAREELIKQLTHYQDASGVRVVIVFDGAGGKLSAEAEEGQIQIFYSASGQTADQVIERLVAKYGRDHEITVATSDLLERVTVSAFGGYTVSCNELRDVLAAAQNELTREIKHLDRPIKASRKPAPVKFRNSLRDFFPPGK